MKRISVLIMGLMCCWHVYGQNIDLRILDKINGPVNEQADKRWRVISDINTPLLIATPVTLFTFGLAKKDKELRIKSYEMAASVAIAELITLSLKSTIRRARPFNEHPESIYRKAKGSGYSFPSGHTSTAFAHATMLSLAFPKWYVIVPSYGIAAAIAYSRMYLGVHYPTDVLLGALIGAGTSVLVYKANWWMDSQRE